MLIGPRRVREAHREVQEQRRLQHIREQVAPVDHPVEHPRLACRTEGVQHERHQAEDIKMQSTSAPSSAGTEHTVQSTDTPARSVASPGPCSGRPAPENLDRKTRARASRAPRPQRTDDRVGSPRDRRCPLLRHRPFLRGSRGVGSPLIASRMSPARIPRLVRRRIRWNPVRRSPPWASTQTTPSVGNSAFRLLRQVESRKDAHPQRRKSQGDGENSRLKGVSHLACGKLPKPPGKTFINTDRFRSLRRN